MSKMQRLKNGTSRIQLNPGDNKNEHSRCRQKKSSHSHMEGK